MSRISSFAAAAAAALYQASAINVEIYYGPYCPNSANYLSMNMPAFLGANIPGVTVEFVPYALNPQTKQLDGSPSEMGGSPTGVLAAPMCALEKFFPDMPIPLGTAGYTNAINFAICDLMRANHGAPPGVTHTEADIQNCATQNGLDWATLQACIATASTDPSYMKDVVKGDSELPPGHPAPFILIDGAIIDNHQSILDAVCAKLPGEPACAGATPPAAPDAAPAGYAKFELGHPLTSGRASAVTGLFAAIAAAVAVVGGVAVARAATRRATRGSAVPAEEELETPLQ